jgi:xylose isomerase
MFPLRFSANAGFYGLRRDRFTQYQPPRSLEERMALIARTEGITGVELKYPADFADLTLAQTLLAEHNLALAAVNVDIKDAQHFLHGALSAPDPVARRYAVTLLQEGMDVAAELGAKLVTTCPLADGYDYPFQLDYSATWGRLIDSAHAVAAHRLDVRFCLEYQPHEPHAHILLNNVGKVLHVCAAVGLPNIGANLDAGHSFAALESPAEAAALLASEDRLFYLHTNDNTGDGGDWDMLSGAVHFWHWLELLYTLDRLGYDGWLGGDIVAKQMDPVAAYRTNTLLIRRMAALLDRIGPEKIAALQVQGGKPAEIFDLLSSFLAPTVQAKK